MMRPSRATKLFTIARFYNIISPGGAKTPAPPLTLIYSLRWANIVMQSSEAKACPEEAEEDRCLRAVATLPAQERRSFARSG